MDKLGFAKSNLSSLTIGSSMGRTITFKLLNQFNLDQLESIENLNFKCEQSNNWNLNGWLSQLGEVLSDITEDKVEYDLKVTAGRVS
jgi:hypothetical protein